MVDTLMGMRLVMMAMMVAIVMVMVIVVMVVMMAVVVVVMMVCITHRLTSAQPRRIAASTPDTRKIPKIENSLEHVLMAKIRKYFSV